MQSTAGFCVVRPGSFFAFSLSIQILEVVPRILCPGLNTDSFPDLLLGGPRIFSPQARRITDGHLLVADIHPDRFVRLALDHDAIPARVLEHGGEAASETRAREPGNGIHPHANSYHFTPSPCGRHDRPIERRGHNATDIGRVTAVGDCLVFAEIPEQGGAHAVTAAPAAVFLGIDCRDGPVCQVQAQNLSCISVQGHSFILTSSSFRVLPRQDREG